MKSGQTENTHKRVSMMSKDVFDIKPFVYSFRVMGGGPESGSVRTAIRPPHWLYHDHALGVIWMLFHNDKNYIGITQLHWCLRFLLDLKNSQGEYTGDVEICIRAIEDNLIEQYAKLGTAMENSESTRKNREKNESIATKQEHDTGNTIMPELTDSTSNNPVKLDEENLSTETIYETARTSTPMETEEPERSKIHKKREKAESSEELCHPARCGPTEGTKKRREIVSFTYNEMISKGPEPCMEQYSIADLFDESTVMSNEQTDDEMKRHKDRAKEDLANSNTKEMVNYLNSSRLQHIETIKKEIETLHGLERIMENLNANGFSAYVTEDLARRMKSLENEDVIKEAGEITRQN